MTFKEIIEQLEKGDLRRIDGKFHVDNDTFIYRAWRFENFAGEIAFKIYVLKEKE